MGALTSRSVMGPSRLHRATAAHAPAVVGALLCVLVLGWLGLAGFALSDYDLEAADAFWALRTGDLDTFFSLAPAYGGSFVLRAPFAWLTALWGGGELAVYRAVSLPGMLACAALAVVVVERMRDLGRSRLDRGVVLIALVASPVALRALEIGHPEELLGGALCVAAVLAAPTRPLAAGVLVGLAVANKPWALVAVPVVVAAVPASRAVRTGLAAAPSSSLSCHRCCSSVRASPRTRPSSRAPETSSSDGRSGGFWARGDVCTSSSAPGSASCAIPPTG